MKNKLKLAMLGMMTAMSSVDNLYDLPYDYRGIHKNSKLRNSEKKKCKSCKYYLKADKAIICELGKRRYINPLDPCCDEYVRRKK